jgi:hypothetical protein
VEYSLFAILSPLLAVGILTASAALSEPVTIGTVDRVQAHVDATQAGQTRTLAVSSDVYFKDRCHSGEGARLQATLKDGTQLTLGENATLVVDEFVYNSSVSRGELSLRVVKGAFLYVGGLGGRLAGKPDEARSRLNHLREAVGRSVEPVANATPTRAPRRARARLAAAPRTMSFHCGASGRP